MNGVINSSDLNALKKISSLAELDLRDAEFQEFINKKDKYKFPSLTTLNILRVSPKFADGKIMDISALSEIKVIETPATNKFLGLIPNKIDSLIINGNSFITRINPVINTPVVIKTLFCKSDSQQYNSSLIPSNIEVFVYKNAIGSQAIHITDDNINLLKYCDEVNSNCIWETNLKKINLSNIKTLGNGAFKNTPIEEIQLSSSIKRIEPETFDDSKVKHVEFTESLTNDRIDFTFPPNITVFIPRGTYNTFSSIIKSPIFEKGRIGKRHIAVTKGKTLENLLPVDSLFAIDTLSIYGVVTLSELRLLKNARNLRVLDLKGCKVIKEQEAINKDKRNLAYNFIKELWIETLNNIYHIRDEQAERQLSYALMGYIAGVSKDKSKEEYDNGNALAIFDHYMAKSLEEDAQAHYKSLGGVSKEERDAINDFMSNYNKVLTITGVNENLLEYMPNYVPSPNYGGEYSNIRINEVINRCKELASLFNVPEPDLDNLSLVRFANEYDPIHVWQLRYNSDTRNYMFRYANASRLSNRSREWRIRCFNELELVVVR